jgi:hypothetical protein
VPITLSEKLYVIFSILISCIVFGYVLNQIGSYFQIQDDQEEDLK